jgi:hypothetical protein
MKTILLSISSAVLLLGCSSCAGHKAVALNPIGAVDVVKVRGHLSTPSVGDITDKERIEKLTAFVNSLPQDWNVPWYGPPVGQIYFDFYKDGMNVGNFYVGQNFFGRDANYGGGHFEFYSQTATETQIRGLGEIVGFDLWKYVQVPNSAP